MIMPTKLMRNVRTRRAQLNEPYLEKQLDYVNNPLGNMCIIAWSLSKDACDILLVNKAFAQLNCGRL